MGQPLYCSAADAGVWGERSCSDGSPPTRDSAGSPCFHGCPAFLHRHLPLRSPPPRPLDPSLHSTAALALGLLQRPSTAAPSRCPTQAASAPVCKMHAAARTVWFSFHLGCHRSAVSLSALNISPLTQTVARMWGLDLLLLSPHPLRAGPVLLTLLFFPPAPSSSWVLHGSVYSFPLVRYSWPVSAGVLHALLYLKVHSWWSRGERCTPCLPTSPPSSALPL